MQLRSIVAAGFACAILLTLGQRVSFASARQHKSRAASQKAQKAPPVSELRKVSETNLPDPAPMIVVGNTECDDSGDIYMVYSTTPPRPGPFRSPFPDPAKLPISRISTNSRTVTKFAVQSLNGYESLAWTSFGVDPSGDVYSHFTARPLPFGNESPRPWDNLLVKFNSDGSVDSTIVLQSPPAGLLGDVGFAPFANGNLLVDGVVATAKGRVPFTAVYDGHGQIVQGLSLPDYPFPRRRPGPGSPRGPANPVQRRGGSGAKASEQKSKEKRGAAGALAAPYVRSLLADGPEDTAYLLRTSVPASLYTVSSDGQVLQHVQVQFPVHGAPATDISQAGRSHVAITYYVSGVDRAGKFYGGNDLAVVDPATGKIVAIYRHPEANLGRDIYACATSPTDFLFVDRKKSGHFAVVKYAGR